MRTHVLALALLGLVGASDAARSDAAQTAASFTGRWEGVVTFDGTDGKHADLNSSQSIVTRDATEPAGTPGPADRGLPIEKAAYARGSAHLRCVGHRRRRRRGARIITFPLNRFR